MSLDRSSAPRATFVLPVYNLEASIERSLREVHEWLSARAEAWELIVVDDASSDSTPRSLDAFLSAHEREAVRRVRLTANRGKGFAVRVGFSLASAPFVVFGDGDLAYPMENVARVLDALEGGADAAIACRVLPRSVYMISPSFFSYLYTRHVLGRAFNLICRMLTVPRLLDTQAGLKGFRSEALRPLLGRLVMDGFSFDVELLRALLDQKRSIREIPVSFRYDSEPSTVRFAMDSFRMFRDLIRIRWRSIQGRYRIERQDRGPVGLVIHADDYGLAPGINRSIEEGLEAGTITSASVLLGGPHAGEALGWAASHPRHDFGVHLNLTRGRPVLPASEVRTLVTRSGRFRSLGGFLLRFYLGLVSRKEVLRELEAQIEAVRRAGVAVTHLDSHEHVHLVPGMGSRVVRPLCDATGLPIRSMDGPFLGPHGWPDPRGMLLAAATRLKRLGRRPLRSAAHGFGTAFAARPTLHTVRSAFARMREGRTYELVFHPGSVDPELVASGDTYLGGREAGRDLIWSEEFKATLRIAGLVPLSIGQCGGPPGSSREVPDPLDRGPQ